MTSFDLVLVVGYFRSATAFLSVVRHLSAELRIGIVFVDVGEALVAKTGAAHALFERLVERHGATVLAAGEQARTRLLIIQQFPYEDAVVADLRARIETQRVAGLMTLAMAGLEVHDRYLVQFGVRKAFVPSLRFTRFLLGRRGAEARYADVELVEVGLPYRDHPLFPEFGADWLIAAPTVFSFSSEAGKQQFLRTVLQLLATIPASDVVAYKPHNGNVLDYFAPRMHTAVARIVLAVPGTERLLGGLARHLSGRVRRELERVLTGVLHLRVLRRARPMAELTPCADIALEAFLPHVRKGVLGGLSNTIWGTLYFGLPFYNCVDPALRTPEASQLLDRSGAHLLDLNLEFFGVPFCAGVQARAARGEHIVRDEDRRGDLLAAIRSELAAC